MEIQINRKHYQATMVLDSQGPLSRLSTIRVIYPRFVHAQLLTHRQFSRSSASSRAIPVTRNLKKVKEDPVMPLKWGKNQKGMQAYEELSGATRDSAQYAWAEASRGACFWAESLQENQAHKQIVNRILEPFLPIEVLITSTSWENFLALRCEDDVQPELNVVAWLILRELIKSKPNQVESGSWHIPYGDNYLAEGLSLEQRLKISVARCARISYLNFSGEINHEDDYRLYEELLKEKHMGPFEHQGWALDSPLPIMSGNFYGWAQYRKKIKGESRKVDLQSLWQKRPSWMEDLE